MIRSVEFQECIRFRDMLKTIIALKLACPACLHRYEGALEAAEKAIKEIQEQNLVIA